MRLTLKQARLLMGFKDTNLIYFLLTLLAATATGTFTIFLLVTYTLARYVTLGGQNILGISELTYTILILFCEFNFNFALILRIQF